MNLTQSAVPVVTSRYSSGNWASSCSNAIYDGLKLTASGQRYWEDTSTVPHQLQRAAVRAVAGDQACIQLNIAVASAFAHYWLMRGWAVLWTTTGTSFSASTDRVDAQNVLWEMKTLPLSYAGAPRQALRREKCCLWCTSLTPPQPLSNDPA